VRELSLHILDALENAVEAGATRIDVRIEEDLGADRMMIEIADNGRGMSLEMAKNAVDPFFTTRTMRHVGLGLPLFAAAARRCQGELIIESEAGRGTTVRAVFRHSHLDRAPLGDMPAALMAILLSRKPVDVGYRHEECGRVFSFDSAAVRMELGAIPLSEPAVRGWLFKTLRQGEAELKKDLDSEAGKTEPTTSVWHGNQ
jgi:anti-sigma regulatory factor (Ser/Thr protein kinase)